MSTITRRICRHLPVVGAATSILVDRTGKIVWKHYGPILPNDTELAQAIERALSSQSEVGIFRDQVSL